MSEPSPTLPPGGPPALGTVAMAGLPVFGAVPAGALPVPGQRLGPYVLERELARGGMGAVFLARHEQLGRQVALKVMLPDGDGELDAARFEREAKALGALQHANVVALHDSGIDANVGFDDDGHRHTAPVGSFANDLTETQCFDLAGNVREWVADLAGTIDGSTVTDPTGPATGSLRVTRGSSWNLTAAIVSLTRREWLEPESDSELTGFRVALTARR